MKMLRVLVCALALAMLTPAVFAKTPKKYQVTGTVAEVTDSTIVIQKGEEKWELARDSSTKIEGKIAVGEKVVVEYRMTATDVAVKPSK